MKIMVKTGLIMKMYFHEIEPDILWQRRKGISKEFKPSFLSQNNANEEKEIT